MIPARLSFRPGRDEKLHRVYIKSCLCYRGASLISLQTGSPYGLFRDLLCNSARSKGKSRNNPYGEPVCRLESYSAVN